MKSGKAEDGNVTGDRSQNEMPDRREAENRTAGAGSHTSERTFRFLFL
jgi:hypothetical protein